MNNKSDFVSIKGGSRTNKLIEIDKYVFEQFRTFRNQRKRVHDRNLTRWGITRARELNILDFRASNTWLLNFKRRHNIVSRKITKQVSRKNVIDKPIIENTVNSFVDKIRRNYSSNPAKIFNSDQTGFQIEMYHGRTHEIKGTRQIEALVESQHSMTHSYTVMPLNSGDGR